jgi:beta-galactosidase/beta-glucuronidase
VRRDRNHPSIVLWSAGNEIGEQTSSVFFVEEPDTITVLAVVAAGSEPPGTGRRLAMEWRPAKQGAA